MIMFLDVVLSDLGTRCCISTTMDSKRAHRRFEHEGVSFLTITLPNFGKDFERSLDQGFVSRNLFQGFNWTNGLPCFLVGFLELVFDRNTGVLLHEPSIDAIFSIRQICLLFGKVELPCSDARVRKAIDAYVKCEQDIVESDRLLSDDVKSSFVRMKSVLFGDMFSDLDFKVYNGELVPKHGSGSTADRLLGNKKYLQHEWTDRLEEYFPAGQYLSSRWGLLDPGTVYLEPGAERPVKVITVPKTLKTPRVIAMEPTAMQYAQQALLEVITEGFMESNHLRNLVSSHDQTPNRNLARDGSLSGNLATLDLSEASDRVSNLHVQLLLSHHPHLRGAVDACRSRTADIPYGYGLVPLRKFASMGSALCFPFEAMVFLTVVFLGIEDELRHQLSLSDVKRYIGKVRVYGDDIIVPVQFVRSVVSKLETFGYRVNAGKSFWTGKFRESCGKDYYDGTDVSVTRVRSMFPTQRKHALELVSVVSTRNQFYLAGLWGTVRYLDDLIGKIIPFPAVESTSSALGKISRLGHEDQGRWDPDLQRPMVKAAVIKSTLPVSRLDGYGALMKTFLKRGELPFADRNHLERAGRSVSVDIKIRWVAPF